MRVHAAADAGYAPARVSAKTRRARVPERAAIPKPRAGPLPLRAYAVPLISAAAAGLVVFHGALAYFFSQDDFLGLARAAGLAPRLSGPWRFLSHQLIFDVMRPLAGLDAWRYHLVSLAIHAACAALLAAFLARRAAAPAALLGAVFFAAHPTLFAAAYWVSAVGDSLALLFALAAYILAVRTDRLHWLALPLFALSLIAKESTVMLPAVVALALRLDPAAPGSPSRGRTVVCLGLAAIALTYVVAFATGDTFAVRSGLPVTAPYASGMGPHVLANALTYLGWSVMFLYPLVTRFGDGVDPTVQPWAVGALVLWLIGLASRRLRGAGWVMGGAIWLLFLLPVLGLRNHTYHYYLYAPLAGAAWCLAAAAECFVPRGRTAWVVGGAVAALLTLNGVLLVRKIELMPFVLPGLRAESIVDRARIADNVRRDLGAATLPPGVTLLFWSPTATSLGPRGERLPTPAPGATYWERNVREALLGGLAVRVMFPQVQEVRFVREFRPTSGNERYAAYLPDGRVRVFTSAEVDSILGGPAARD
jgi:hypothetical protein